MALFTDTIQTEQVFSRKSLGLLWAKRESLDPQTVARLDALYKERNKGSIAGSLKVKYKLSPKEAGKFGFGRLYGSMGSLEGLENECRGTICDEFYYDIDIVNAHPTFIPQFAKRYYNREMPEVQKYVDNRDEYLAKVSPNRDVAKTAIIKIMYGGKCDIEFLEPFKKEIDDFTSLLWDESKYAKLRNYCEKEKSNNPRGSFLSYIIQTEERKVMLTMRNALMNEGWSVDVLSYDGVMIRKNMNLVFGPDLLRRVEKAIVDEQQYDVKVTNKLFSKYEFTDAEVAGKPEPPKDRNPVQPMGTIVDDAYAARHFALLQGANLVKVRGQVWIFNDTNGMWSNKEADINTVITNLGWRMVFYVESGTGVSTYNYAGSVKNWKALMTALTAVLPAQDSYFLDRIKSDFGYLLFSDGIYSFRDKKFTPGFDRNIVFQTSTGRPFPERNQELVDFVRQTSFVDPFVNEGDSAVLRHNLMRALIGDYERKKMVVGLGFINSGKGMLTQLCTNAFGGYVNTFNANELISKRETSESSRALGWIQNIAHGRFAFSNEIKVGQSMDGNLIKSIVSGGDSINVRALYQQDTPTINKSTLFMFAQDMPPVKPSGDAIKGRIEAVSWSYSYNSFPTEPHHKLMDTELPKLYQRPEYGSALFWLLVDEYEAWRADGFKNPKNPECVLENLENFVPVVNTIELLKTAYVISKDSEDFVPFADIYKTLKQMGVEDSETAVGRLLTVHGATTFQKKIDGRNVTCRRGIKAI
jgi:hypothetical protein